MALPDTSSPMFNVDSIRLPAGIRDFAPGAASARRYLAETLIRVYEQWGFAQVITPVFEYEDVLARGLGDTARAETVRFVEPSSGQVLALRPDITPQIARLCATRYSDERGPIRLCYEGPVFRFDRNEGTQKEVIQAGAELCGLSGTAGDVEMIALAASALEAIGLSEPTVDLAHLGLARELLKELALPDRLLERFRERVARRDRAEVAVLLEQAKGAKNVREFAAMLPTLSGDTNVIAAAAEKAPTARMRAALSQLQDVVNGLKARGVKAALHVDLNEIRGFEYYTGLRFSAFVEGSAQPVLAGGRYDELIGGYGYPRPAVGFAVDVESAALALENRGKTPWRERASVGTLVVGRADEAAHEAERLRSKGARVAVFPDELSHAAAREYAKRWGFADVVFAGMHHREKKTLVKGSRKRG